MHYYKRNLGDYAKKAGRLSMLQHGSYTLLIDACYDREQFPTMEEAIEWTWASTTEEIEAVQFVLRKFFLLEDGVYVQTRIREELEEYRLKAETNKRIATERETNRKAKSTNRSPDVNETPPNHKPLTINQLNTLSGKPDPVPEKPKKQTRTREAEEVLAHLNKVCGSRFQPVAANMNLITARLREGATVDDMKTVIDRKYADWRNDDEMRKYLRPETLFNATKFAGYLGAADEKKPVPAIPFDRDARDAERKAFFDAAKARQAAEDRLTMVYPEVMCK